MSDAPLIYTALAAVMDEVKVVEKRDHNDFQNFNFRGIDAVVNAVGPALRKHKVIVVPQALSADYAEVTTSNGKASTACRVMVTYVFAASDGSQIEATVAGEAWDTGDKACPKAMSVAFRTALLQALALPTDEVDPDAETFERAPSKKTAGKKSNGGATNNECAECGQPITVGAPIRSLGGGKYAHKDGCPDGAPSTEADDDLGKLRERIRKAAEKHKLVAAMPDYLADVYETASLDSLDQPQLLEIAADLHSSSGRKKVEEYGGVTADA